MTAHYDSIILGAGAAGLYCALHAGRRGKRVLVLEHNEETGAKILISGGGRCNFTNVNAGDHTRYLSANPHFARSALSRHGPDAFIALVQKHRIEFYEKTLGQLFCEGARSSRKIVAMLQQECAAGGVEIRTSCEVGDVRRVEHYIVETSYGAFSADTLVVASGGLSIPQLGSTALAYQIAKQFGVPVIAPRPALVPFTFARNDAFWTPDLAGVSTEAIVSIGKTRFLEAALFTHRGLSGPAILQASSYWKQNDYVIIDWLPNAGEDVLVAAKRERPLALPKTALTAHLPERLATYLSAACPPRPLGEWKDDALIAFAQSALKQARLKPAGTEGYAKAEVTAGGIDVNALSQQTMEVRAVPGLFFIGEAADVTGWLGGYNFQWAWSSGWAAAQAL